MKCFSGANFPVVMNLFLYASIARVRASRVRAASAARARAASSTAVLST
jgi:hypothetical protein